MLPASEGLFINASNQLENDGTDEGFSGVIRVRENQPHHTSLPLFIEITVPSIRVILPDEVYRGRAVVLSLQVAP